MAVALTLGKMLQFNAAVTDADCHDPRGIEHVKACVDLLLKLLDQPTVEHGAERIQSLQKSVGAPLRLRDVGVKNDEIAWIARQVNAERLSNNPRKMTERDIEEILVEIW